MDDQSDPDEAESGLLQVLDRIRTLNQDRVQFFAQLATLIPAATAPTLQDNDDIKIPEFQQFWREVLQWLVSQNQWRGVYCLFNPRNIQPGDGQWSLLHGRAAGFSVEDIRVCDLLQSTSGQDLRAWGMCLALWLLNQGARIELISSDHGESLTIAAVKASLKAGVLELLSYVFEMRPELTLSLDDPDQAGDSPLHLCVKFQQPDADHGASVVLQTLLDLGCCTTVKDRQLKTPIQYVEEPDPRYTMLSHAANHAGRGLIDRVSRMKKLGDDHFKKDEFEESLSWYKKALVLAESTPNMKMELVLLHCSCSSVYANLAVLDGDATASLEMCKKMCKIKDDLSAVLSNVRNPCVTPNEYGTLQDRGSRFNNTETGDMSSKSDEDIPEWMLQNLSHLDRTEIFKEEKKEGTDAFLKTHTHVNDEYKDHLSLQFDIDKAVTLQRKQQATKKTWDPFNVVVAFNEKNIGYRNEESDRISKPCVDRSLANETNENITDVGAGVQEDKVKTETVSLDQKSGAFLENYDKSVITDQAQDSFDENLISPSDCTTKFDHANNQIMIGNQQFILQSEESDTLFELNGTTEQLESQLCESDKNMEDFVATRNGKSDGISEELHVGVANQTELTKITKQNSSIETNKDEGCKKQPQIEITEINERKSVDKHFQIEDQSEVPDKEKVSVMSVMEGDKSSQISMQDLCSCVTVGEITRPASKDDKSLSDNEAKPTKKTKCKKKEKPEPIVSDGQTLKGVSNQKDDQDGNEPVSNPEMKREQVKSHQAKEKTISECKKSIIEFIQDQSSLISEDKSQEQENETKESTEIDDLERRDGTVKMDDDDTEELGIDIESFDNATWEIECTANAWKQMKEDNVPISVRHQIIMHLHQLAFGDWMNVPCKKLHNVRKTYATRVSKSLDVFMVWEIAVAFSGRCSDDPDQRIQGKSYNVTGGRVYTEIIRIWGVVFSQEDLTALAELISKSHTRAEDCILKRKLKVLDGKKYEIGTRRRIPRQFSEVVNEDQGKTLVLCPPASPNKTEYHILKFYVFSSALINILLHVDTKRVDVPFKVTHREHAIIHLQADTPILLLGRSGTGKTTCCLYRLWNNFIWYWQIQDGNPFLPRVDYLYGIQEDTEDEGDASTDENEAELESKFAADEEINDSDAGGENDTDEEAADEEDYGVYDNLHQMFVTKNPVLCYEVKKNFLEFCAAHEVTLEHVEAATTEMPAMLQDVPDLSYPLFLTSRKLLLMLDASLGPPHFFARNEDGSLKMTVDGWDDESEENTILLHHDSDDENEFAEVHDVQQEHFSRPVKRKQDIRKEVTYDVFVDKVWPKLQKKIGVRYHPSLVWTEMISFIMGSQDALYAPKGYLLEKEYMEIGKKRAPNFSGDRSKVYELFLRYVHFKSQHQMFDEADFVRHIFQRLNKTPELPWVLHQLYVDETQDFTQSELSVLLRITQDPNKMFLTGDTAQGIMRGISFRFCDLKSLFHQAKTSLEAHQKQNLNEPKEVYQLIHSYRSHVGILNLASSVLELMVEFFPESFDRLKKDQGLFHGPQPILLESCSVEDLMILIQGNNRDTSHIEFGAHQAILVVNQSAKTTMPQILNNNSIVLTIFESKGLEFDDVLLYNFFTDSEASKEWRVVTQFLETLSKQETQEEVLDNIQKIDHEMLRQPNRPRALDFDPIQHKVLNSELKNLYTALTRARVNVWLFDEDVDKRAPMFEYFKARMLVRSGSVSDSCSRHSNLQDMVFAMKSSKSDWIKRGDEMMAKSLYDTASKCYEMGFDRHKTQLALAHRQAQRAKEMRDSPREMKEAYIRAADRFYRCGEALKATQCLQNAQEYKLAADAYFKMDNLLDAARMFQRARNFTKAYECLIAINQYGNAVHMLDKAELFEQAINCLKQYEEKVKMIRQEGNAVPQDLIDNKPKIKEKDLWRKLVQTLHSQSRKADMLKALSNLSQEEQFEYLEKHKYYREAAERMLDDGTKGPNEAAEMLLRNGIFKLALEYAEKGKDANTEGKCHQNLALEMMSSYHSEMDRDQEVYQKIVNHLKQAKAAFLKAENRNGVAMSMYHLSKLTKKIRDAKEAYALFQAVKPFPNQVGMIESWLIVVKSINKASFQDCRNLFVNIDTLLSVLQTILSQPNSEYTMYMQFYGLHENVLEPKSLLVYPKHNPLCTVIMPDFFRKNERKKFVSRNKDIMSFQISLHLGKLLNFFVDTCREWLKPIASRLLQCITFIEGRTLGLTNTCKEVNCQKLHKDYDKSSAQQALETLFLKVRLEGVLSQGVESILRIRKKTKERMEKLLPGTSFECCYEFLDFVMSPHRYTGRFSGSRELMGHPSMKFVRKHVMNFLNLQKGDTLEESCRSVDWIVRCFTFSALLRLDIDTRKECCAVKAKVQPNEKFLEKEKEFAFLCMHRDKDSLVELFGTLFLDACENLQRNVQRAVLDYTKYAKILGEKERLSIFPKWPLFFFWHETFLTVALVTLTKMSEKSNCVLPASYLQTMAAVDACFTKSKMQETVNNTVMNQPNTDQFQRRLVCFASVLCGYQTKANLLRDLFQFAQNVNFPDFLTFERCLVFALVIMANVGRFSSVIIQELMKTVKTIQLLESLPKRLENALKAVQNAKGIADVVAALHQLLQNREKEQLFCCKWKWNQNRKVGIFQDELKSFEKFSSTFSSDLKEGGKNTEVDADIEIVIHESEKNDFDQRLHEQRIYQQERREDDSARIIQRFFRTITFKGRLQTGGLVGKCTRLLVEEFLIPYRVTQTVCGICSVPLSKDTIQSLEQAKLQTKENNVENPSEDLNTMNDSCQSIAMMLIHSRALEESVCVGKEDGETQPQKETLETYDVHVNSQKHQVNARDFKAFKELYEEYFLIQVPEVHRFVLSLRNQQIFITNPLLQLGTFDSLIDLVSSLLASILTERKWNLVFDLRTKVTSLVLHYKEAETDMWIQQQFYQHQYQQQSYVDQTTHQLQPTMTYGATAYPYHELYSETFDGDQGLDLVNVEYQPTETPFGQYDNKIHQQHQRGQDDGQAWGRQSRGSTERSDWHLRRDRERWGGPPRRYREGGNGQSRGYRWDGQPRRDGERWGGQPRQYRKGGGSQPRREGEVGNGQSRGDRWDGQPRGYRGEGQPRGVGERREGQTRQYREGGGSQPRRDRGDGQPRGYRGESQPRRDRKRVGSQPRRTRDRGDGQQRRDEERGRSQPRRDGDRGDVQPRRYREGGGSQPRKDRDKGDGQPRGGGAGRSEERGRGHRGTGQTMGARVTQNLTSKRQRQYQRYNEYKGSGN